MTMPRHRRVVIPNCPHHITQRGNNRRDVFFSDADRDLYLTLLKKYTSMYGVQILGYCLMTNHVHVIAIPAAPSGLAKVLGRVHNDYARWLNIRRRESGHVWQNRFFSCPIEFRHLWAVLAYVERNPVRAGLVSSCDAWPWSSAAAHLSWSSTSSGLTMDVWAQHWTRDLWRMALEVGLNEAEIQGRLAEATQTGRPFGENPFVEACEQRIGLSLRKLKPGPKARTSVITPETMNAGGNWELW
jgi:REP-associated tyrosine transposase